MLKKLTYSIGLLLVSAQLSNAQIVISPPSSTIGVLCPTCITGSLTSGRVVIASGAATVTDDADLTWNSTTNRLVATGAILQGSANTTIPELADTPAIAAINQSGNSTIMSVTASAGSNYGAFAMMSPRGTLSVPTSNQNGDITGEVQFYGFNGTWFSDTAFIESGVEGVPDGTGTPGYLQVYVNTGASNQKVIHIHPTGVTDFLFDVTLANGKALQTDTTDAHTMLLSAYDVNGTAYVPLMTFTNANAPSLVIAPSGDGTVSVTSRYTATGSTPSVANVGANSCGTTTATIAGNDNAGLITVGTVAGTQCRITFTAAAPNRWQCAANNETTANLLRTTYIDTTHVDILGTMVAGDSLSYICAPR